MLVVGPRCPEYTEIIGIECQRLGKYFPMKILHNIILLLQDVQGCRN